MTFLDAVKAGKWIKRRGTTKVICVSETPTHLYNMVRSDLLANDWEVFEPGRREPEDPALTRFSLMELDLGEDPVSR